MSENQFLAISDRCGTFIFFEIFDKMAGGGHFGCLKITFDHIFGHFRSIDLFGCPKFTFDRIFGHFRSMLNFFFQRPFWMSENHFRSHFWPFQIDRPFWMSENHFRSHFWPFHIDTEFFFYILDGTTMSIIELVRDIWMSNACVKFEEHSLNTLKVIALTMKLWRGGHGGGSSGCVADKNIIFPKTW